jgi:SAM-dependent methyltransferase
MDSNPDAPAHWYRTFFHGLAVELWRGALPAEHTQAEVELLLRELALPTGGRVLDVPCGHGRHAVELARRGYRVTGLDISAEALSHARAAADAAGVTVEWRQADMAEAELPAGGYDGAYMLGNSFAYLEETGTAAESILPHLEPTLDMQLGGIRMLAENYYRAAESCLETRFTFTRGSEVQTGTTLQRVYTAAEIGRMLSEAGFRVLSHLGSGGVPYALGSRELYCVAERE